MHTTISSSLAVPGFQSPILKTSLELLIHACEHFSEGTARDYRICTLHLAHAAELAVKAALVERNQSIYLGSGKTLDIHTALNKLREERKLQGTSDLPHRSKLDLLIDERNAIQHRYGTVDEVTMRYLLDGAFRFLSDLVDVEFGIDLQNYLELSVSHIVRRSLSFLKSSVEESLVRVEKLALEKPAGAVIELTHLLTDHLFDLPRMEESRCLFKPDKAIERFEELLQAKTDLPCSYSSLMDQLASLHKKVMLADHAVSTLEAQDLLALRDLFNLRDAYANEFEEACQSARKRIIMSSPGGGYIISDAPIAEIEAHEAQQRANKIDSPTLQNT